MSSSGKGRFLGAGKMRLGQLLPRPDLIAGDQTSPVAFDWMFGNTPPHVTCIPYSWLVQPLRFRPDAPINVVDVSRTGADMARSRAVASALEYGENAVTPIELHTDNVFDPRNLGDHITGNYAEPRMRCPALTFDLLQHTDTERWLILGREVGDRIRLTGTPATWPENAVSLLIEGVQHPACGIDARIVAWNTSPIVGVAAATPGPWFRADVSLADGPDKLAF